MNATHYVKHLMLFGILKKATPGVKWSSQSQNRKHKTMDTRIILSTTWVVVTLTYLYGDVFRICSGDLAKKPMSDMNLNQYVWLGLAVLMLIPILMVFLTL
jgi:hypothetical protein